MQQDTLVSLLVRRLVQGMHTDCCLLERGALVIVLAAHVSLSDTLLRILWAGSTQETAMSQRIATGLTVPDAPSSGELPDQKICA